jgi:hypothetical protein
LAERIDLLDIGLEQRAEAKVDAETGSVVGVHQEDVVLVFDIHVPTHQPHLQAQDGGIAPII